MSCISVVSILQIDTNLNQMDVLGALHKLTFQYTLQCGQSEKQWKNCHEIQRTWIRGNIFVNC